MKKIIIFFFVFVYIFLTNNVFAETKTKPKQKSMEAIIEKIIEEKTIKPMGSENKQLYQKLELLVTKGKLKGKKIIVENGNVPLANIQKYHVNDKVMVHYSKDSNGNNIFYITDYIRTNSIVLLFIIFIIFTIIIAKWRGLTSLIGMGISFFVIFNFILPQISMGANPVTIAVLGSFIIIPITFFFSHGLNQKTIVAIIGTLITLILTGIMAHIFVNAAHLTGFASEEASFLQIAKSGTMNIKGLLLAGIIIGVLGVLDDITISQSAIVFQLKETNTQLQFKQLYTKAMSIGQDHISSMVNTLILVYTGAALPLLILFIDNPQPFSEIINYEIIADEIIRTLVGSIGLIVAVPITTLIAAFAASKERR